MKKRILSILLAAALVLTLIPLGAPAAKAASNLVISDAGIEMIKKWEGFSAKPYWDYRQWTVGYGTRVPDGKLEEYQTNGISVEEATVLLKLMLEDMGRSVNGFIDKFGLTINQNQFDALMSLTFNCGSGWVYETSTLRTSVIDGWKGSDLLFAIGQWSTAGGETQPGLIRRRLAECNMYLNGTYDINVPANYCYVRFNPNGGTSEIKTQCYISDSPVAIRAVPTYEGYNFEGWFTDPTGGEKVTQLDAGVRNYTLYAHWSAGNGADTPQDNNQATITGNPVNYDRQIATGVLNAFVNPVKGALVTNAYQLGDVVNITAEYTDTSSTKWGKVKDGGWINLSYTQEPSSDSQDTMSVKVTVTATDVNVRRGPGTGYACVGKANKGDQLTITQTATGTGYTWGKFSGGWIALKYTNFDQVSAGDNNGNTNNNTTPDSGNQNNNGSTTVIATGKVKVTSGMLNIRKGPSTGYAVVGGLNNATPVEILEKKTVGATEWGRISKGWISLDYVTLDTPKEEPAPEPTTPAPQPQPENPTPAPQPQPETPAPTPQPQPETPAPTPQPNPGTTPTVETGKVVLTSGTLNVRSDAGTHNRVVGYLRSGAVVQITEKKTVGSTVWGKISNGWISMDYVQLNNTASTPSQKVGGTVSAGGSRLRVRTGPGTSYAIAGYVNDGSRVEILEQKTAGGMVWGRVSNGWISLSYVTLDGQSSNSGSTNAQTGNVKTGTVTADCLHIRSAAGTTNKIVGLLYTGARVTILETTVVNGMTWGRIDKGWISMDYVR